MQIHRVYLSLITGQPVPPGRSLIPDDARLVPRSVQCRSPTDPRHGSIDRIFGCPRTRVRVIGCHSASDAIKAPCSAGEKYNPA